MLPPFHLTADNRNLFAVWRSCPAEAGVPCATVGHFLERSRGAGNLVVVEARIEGTPRIVHAGPLVATALHRDPTGEPVTAAFSLESHPDVLSVRACMYSRPVVVVSHSTFRSAPDSAPMQAELLLLPFVIRTTGDLGYLHGNAMATRVETDDLDVGDTLIDRHILMRRFYDPATLEERSSPLTIPQEETPAGQRALKPARTLP